MATDVFRPVYERREVLSANEMKAQIAATSGLVSAIHNKLDSDKEVRDPESNGEDERIYDAFFTLGSERVMEINCVGSPNEDVHDGLFLYIYKKSENPNRRAEQLLGLQTAKKPDIVNDRDALWLSRYSSAQLNELANLVRGGEKITRSQFVSFITPITR